MKMDKEKIKKFKPFILPVITMVLIFTFLIFYLPGKTSDGKGNAITGFFVREPVYEISGYIELGNLDVQRDNNCKIFLEILSKENKTMLNNYTLGIDNFLEKDGKYVFNLEALKIPLEPGDYLIDVLVYCNGVKTSESEKEITI